MSVIINSAFPLYNDLLSNDEKSALIFPTPKAWTLPI